ncbi:MAG: hypothetical protein JNM99_12175 [Verrucomicrobiaceae bacterium]|nr:hypothetical protein [Verrucomicrobiaceae bacterium]
MLQPYVWAIDDYPLSQMAQLGFVNYLQDAFEQRGAWRLLQHGMVGWIVNAGTWLPGVIAVGSHVLTSQFFYLVFAGLCVTRDDALKVALLAACAPFGFQAISWTSALPYVLSSLVAWASLWLFLHHRSTPKGLWIAWGCVFAATLLVHDHLLFALAAVAVAAWLLAPQPSLWRQAWLQPSTRWLPPLMACAYLVAYFWWKPTDHPLYMEPHFHWPSLVGPAARLWQWLDVWEPFPSLALWQIAASEWPAGGWGAGACIAAGVASLWLVHPERSRNQTLSKHHATRIAVAMLLLFLMASLIYVPAGGYSLDSRKRYPLFLFFLGGVGTIALPWGRRLFTRARPWLSRAAMSLLATACMLACWLHVGLWRAEGRASRLLSDFLAANPAFRQVCANKLIDPAKVSPAVARLHGVGWIQTAYLHQPFLLDHPAQALPEIRHSPGQDIPELIYDYRNREWRALPSLTPTSKTPN